MRRPSPIQPPPQRQEPGAPTEGGTLEADQPFVSAFVRAPRRGRKPDPGDVRDPASTDESSIPDATDDDSTAPVGLRDVWRAARARRRALQAEARRFTAAQRRRRRIWIGVAAAFVLLVGGSLAAAYSPLFAVRTIDVAGTSTLNAATVEQSLSGELGKPFPLVDQSAIKAALVRFPMVESYTVEAVPPHELVVRIVERTPVGAVQTAAGYTVVDAAGVALSTTPTAPKGVALITVNGGIDSKSFQALGQVMRALPASIRDQVTAVSAKSPVAVVLTLGKSGTTVVWGSADQTADKVVRLETLMKAKGLPSGVHEFDVSAPNAVVVR
jgi:cell division protein FtsQ